MGKQKYVLEVTQNGMSDPRLQRLSPKCLGALLIALTDSMALDVDIVLDDDVLKELKREGIWERNPFNAGLFLDGSGRKGINSNGKMNVDMLVKKWNKVAGNPHNMLRAVTVLNKTRRRQATLRVKEIPLSETWDKVMAEVERSSFLRGDTPRGWKCTFDWLIKNDSNVVKILDGNYRDSYDRETPREAYPSNRSQGTASVKELRRDI